MTKWFRVCALCAYSLPPIDLFCDFCWENYHRKINETSNQHQQEMVQQENKLIPFPIHYLWEWKVADRAQKFSIGDLIYFLKHAPLPAAHERMAQWILQKNAFLYSGHKKPAAIVFPVKQKSDKDHAYYLANAIARQLDIAAIPLRLRPLERNYKKLGRRARYKERAIEGLKMTGQKLLFVDDVLTTGATAYRAWQALGQGEGFCACVLAYKSFKGVQETAKEASSLG